MIHHKYEMSSYKAKPEYRQALQELIKFEIQALVCTCACITDALIVILFDLILYVPSFSYIGKGLPGLNQY